LADTEDVWDEIFKENGSEYSKPTLVMFTEQTQSGCGFSSAATGPFYCPSDEKVYIDLSFLMNCRNVFMHRENLPWPM
jgi:predicted metalloprotease